MSIVDLLGKINWNYIWSLFTLFLGAGITYFLTLRREKDKLRKDLQIKAADEVSIASTKVREESNSFIGYNISLIKLFCLVLKNEPDNTNKNEISSYFKDDLFVKIQEDFSNSFYAYTNAVDSFIRKFEARRIILAELWNEIDFFYRPDRNITNIRMEIYSILFNILNQKAVTIGQLDKLKIALEKINKIIILDSGHIHSLNQKIQNTYFSELFKRTIPIITDQTAVNILTETYINRDADSVFSELEK